MADSPTAPHPDLLALRHQIDAVDRELLALLNRRAAIASHVGELKKKEGSVVFRPEREAQVIDGLKARIAELDTLTRIGQHVDAQFLEPLGIAEHQPALRQEHSH